MCDNPFHFIRYCLIFFGSGSEELVSSRGASRISQSRIFSISVNGLTWIQQTRWIVTPTVSCTNWNWGVCWRQRHTHSGQLHLSDVMFKQGTKHFLWNAYVHVEQETRLSLFPHRWQASSFCTYTIRMNQLKTTGPCRMKWNETR